MFAILIWDEGYRHKSGNASWFHFIIVIGNTISHRCNLLGHTVVT